MYLEMASDARRCLRILTLLRSVCIVLLPFYHHLQSVAAGFHGSATASLHPAGVSHPDEHIFPLPLFFGFHGGSDIYYFISFDFSAVLGCLRWVLSPRCHGEEEEEEKKAPQGHLR